MAFQRIGARRIKKSYFDSGEVRYYESKTYDRKLLNHFLGIVGSVIFSLIILIVIMTGYFYVEHLL